MGIFSKQKPQSKEGKDRQNGMMYASQSSPSAVFDLSNCDMISIPAGVFIKCKNLQKTTLDLSGNRLKTLEGYLDDLGELVELRLRGNNFKRLPKDFMKLESLVCLDLSGNVKFDMIDECLQLPELRVLKIRNTAVNKIPKSTFDRVVPIMIEADFAIDFPEGNTAKVKEKLQKAATVMDDVMELQFCELFVPPAGLYRDMKIQMKTRLDLSHNHLLSLAFPNEEKQLIELDLTSVNLSHNSFSTVPSFFAQFDKLTEIDLSHNQLCFLPKAFKALKSLQILNLSHNQLLSALPKPPNLTSLDISFTRIELPQDFTSKLQVFKSEPIGLIPRCSLVRSSSDDEVVDLVRKDKEEQRMEYMRNLKIKEEEAEHEILTRVIFESEREKYETQLLRKKQEETAENAKLLSKIEEEQNLLFKDKLAEFEAHSASLVAQLCSAEKEAREREDFIDFLKNKEKDDLAHFKITQERQNETNLDFVNVSMRILLEKERDLANNLKLHQRRDDEHLSSLKSYLLEEEEMAKKYYDLAVQTDGKVRKNLEEADYFQKLACQRAIEQNDLELQEIRRNAEMVKKELQKITQLEVDRQHGESKEMRQSLEDRRLEMSSLLGKFMKDEANRQKQARSLLDTIETQREENQALFWVHQFERLMQEKPLALQRMEANMDRRVLQIIQRSGTIDSIECFAANGISFEQLRALTHKDLEKIGVFRLGDRIRILEQISVDDGVDEFASAPKAVELETVSKPDDGPKGASAPFSGTVLPKDQPVYRDDNNECCICMEYPSKVCFLPCGHVCVCRDCSETLQLCPLCRGDINDKILLLS